MSRSNPLKCVLIFVEFIGLGAMPMTSVAASHVGVTLFQAEQTALHQAPELKSLGAKSDALKQSAIAAGQLSDPKLMLGAMNVPVDTFDFSQEPMTQVQVGLMQTFPRFCKVLSWELSNTMESSFCISALERAIRLYGKPDIFNSDQGSQFTGGSFTTVLKDNGIKISMDGKGRWMDNVFIERLWRSVKYENIYLNEYASVNELRRGLKHYFQYYNVERTHQSLNSLTPTEVYNADMKKAA